MKKLFNVLVAVYVFICAMLLFGTNGKAYIDPSVMTYVIQAVAGVVIAVGAAVGIYWRKAKKKAQEKLGIKETKEEESDEIVVNEEVAEEAAENVIADAKEAVAEVKETIEEAVEEVKEKVE